jgi:hypothetical protein
MKKNIFAGIIFLFLFVSVAPAFAANLIPCGTNENPQACTLCDFLRLGENIVDFLLFTIVPALAALMLAVGGVMYFLSGINSGLLKKAKDLLTYVVVGIVVLYSSWLIINTFFMLIGLNQAGSFGFDLKQWWNFPCE